MHLVTSTSDLIQVCNRLSSAEFITVDTEFMREQTFWPELCLVQVASDTVEAIIDPLAPGIDLKVFYALMANEQVTKVSRRPPRHRDHVFGGRAYSRAHL
jgi:ribonuclease D